MAMITKLFQRAPARMSRCAVSTDGFSQNRLDWPRPGAEDDIARLDPSVLPFRTVGFHSQQDDRVRASRHRLHPAVHSRHEPGIVVDVVIARQNRDRATRRDGSQTEQRVENRRGGPATERLLDHVAIRKLGKRRSVIRLVLARHDDDGAARGDERGGSPAGLVQERLGADDGAVLLGPVVSDELASERPQAFSVSAGEDDGAIFRSRRGTCLLAGTRGQGSA